MKTFRIENVIKFSLLPVVIKIKRYIIKSKKMNIYILLNHLYTNRYSVIPYLRMM